MSLLDTITKESIGNVAKIFHEASRIFSESMWIISNLPWDSCDDEFKNFLIKNVEYRISNPSCSLVDQYNFWVQCDLDVKYIVEQQNETGFFILPMPSKFDDLPIYAQTYFKLLQNIVDTFLYKSTAPYFEEYQTQGQKDVEISPDDPIEIYELKMNAASLMDSLNRVCQNEQIEEFNKMHLKHCYDVLSICIKHIQKNVL